MPDLSPFALGPRISILAKLRRDYGCVGAKRLIQAMRRPIHDALMGQLWGEVAIHLDADVKHA